MTYSYKKMLEDAEAVTKRFRQKFGRTPDYQGQKERAEKGGRPRFGETKEQANKRRNKT